MKTISLIGPSATCAVRSHFLLILAVCLILVFTICAFDLPFYATTIVYPLIYGDSRVYNQTCYESLTMPGDSWDAVLHNVSISVYIDIINSDSDREVFKTKHTHILRLIRHYSQNVPMARQQP